MRILSERLEAQIGAMQEETAELIRQLCAIPAPSHHEERRAALIQAWFERRGMKAEVDEAKNVLCPIGLEEHEDMVVVMAHTDTVFPDMEPMPMREENGRLYCPGVGDDTTNLAALMMLASLLKEAKPRCGVLFVANACEEGLGNLKGCKAIMKAFGPRVKAFLSLDGDMASVCVRAVGSARYRITANTKGGHSFADFGSRNAIAVLAKLIDAFYAQDIPRRGTSATTYNVGLISGGTSVNAIAQQARMLYEYRSDDAACLAAMEGQMRAILKACVPEDAEVAVELIGERPCAGNVDPAAQAELQNACCAALGRYVGRMPAVSSGSTDCNIPLSMGIPSACFGVYRGEGEHTREEWVELASIEAGMKAALSVLLEWFEPEE
ncbi:MAG: M20/M25/M40 family metallo-hydrolase [Clostridia bacterium]|nr:M20/M25/M40 family metallo-hydrolase [Clostridia bacterium]